MRARIATFVAVFQSVVLLGHIFLYETWNYFWQPPARTGFSPLQVTLAILSVSFVAASLLAFRYTNPLLRWFYTLSAVWLGALSFFFFAAIACWITYGALLAAGVHVDGRLLDEIFFGAAAAISLYGVVNAAWPRVRRIRIKLPNLPASWRGRKAALVSDMHLGHVKYIGFARRITRAINRLKPDIVWIAGDMYDGTAVDAKHAASPLKKLQPPFGTFFVEGNHEEFRYPEQYLEAVRANGMRVLENEKAEIDGLQIVGVPYKHATHAQHFGSVLDKIGIDRDRASVLLTHAPDHVAVAEAAGIGLQVSGHTHVGQMIPYNWIATRIYRQFVYGLNRIGKMLVYTSSGAGTWGPPLRVGTQPEIVLFEFE